MAVEIREELRGEISDGEALAGARQKALDQSECGLAGNLALDLNPEAGAIDRGEVLLEISLEEVEVAVVAEKAAHLGLDPAGSVVRAHADAASVAARHEDALEDRPDDSAEGVLSHAIRKAKRGDLAWLGLEDHKLARRGRNIGAGGKGILQREKVYFRLLFVLQIG